MPRSFIHLKLRPARRFRVIAILLLAAARLLAAAGLLAPARLLEAQGSILPVSQRMANATMQRWPNGRFAAPEKPWQWNYELGTLLEGMDAVWLDTANGDYYRYIKGAVDPFVGTDGTISSYDQSEYQLDNILTGRQLLLLYRVTQEKRYYEAATHLRRQLASQPRNPSGGFWHKQIYPN